MSSYLSLILLFILSNLDICFSPSHLSRSLSQMHTHAQASLLLLVNDDHHDDDDDLDDHDIVENHDADDNTVSSPLLQLLLPSSLHTPTLHLYPASHHHLLSPIAAAAADAATAAAAAVAAVDADAAVAGVDAQILLPGKCHTASLFPCG